MLQTLTFHTLHNWLTVWVSGYKCGCLPVRTECISWTSSCSSMLASLTTLLFFCTISAARKGHLEPTAWPAGGATWPGGNLTSCFWSTEHGSTFLNYKSLYKMKFFFAFESPLIVLIWTVKHITGCIIMFQLTIIGWSAFGRRSWRGQSSGQRSGGQVHHHRALLGIARQRWLPSQLQANTGHNSQERAPSDHCVHVRYFWPKWGKKRGSIKNVSR